MSKLEWKTTTKGNQTLEGEDFYISYNGFDDESIVDFGPAFASDNDQSETALCKSGKFYILNGDWRKQYEELVPKGWGECIKFFDSKPELKSSWSN